MRRLEDPGLSDSDLFRGYSFPLSVSDQECAYCGMWFSVEGLRSHQENCPVEAEPKLDREAVERILKKCEECGCLGEFHLAGCSEAPDMPAEVPDGMPIV